MILKLYRVPGVARGCEWAVRYTMGLIPGVGFSWDILACSGLSGDMYGAESTKGSSVRF